MIPYSITVGNAAAPEKSLSFLFWGAGVFVLPVIAVYTAVSIGCSEASCAKDTAERHLTRLSTPRYCR
jgi:hypothetical protein